jgi:arsenate reductase
MGGHRGRRLHRRAYWCTSSTSFVNPAVTIARTLSDTFAGLTPNSVPGFLVTQAVGGLLGYLLARAHLPDPASQPEPASAAAPQEIR